MAEATRMEFITEEVYRRLLNPDLFDEISRFVFIHGKFEEIPIINRYNDVVFLEKNFSPREISMCLFHLAQRLLLDIRAYLLSTFPIEVYNEAFFCLTFVNFNEELSDYGFCIPNIFVSTKSTVNYLSLSTIIDIEQDHSFFEVYSTLLNIEDIEVYKTISGEDDEVERIYITIPLL